MTALRSLFLAVVFSFITVSAVLAQNICTFQGLWDVSRRSVQADCSFSNNGKISFSAEVRDDQSIQFRLSAKSLQALIFHIAAEASGSIRVVEPSDGVSFVEVMLSQEEDQVPALSHKGIQGKLDIVDDKIFVRQLRGAGIQCQGQVSFLPPYDMDLTFLAKDMLLSDLFAWLNQAQESVMGDVSGQIRVTGFIERLLIKGRLASSGQIGNFRYDEITTGIEGVYPMVRLIDASVTETNGVSFFLEGQIDLSKDFKDFAQQLAKMKMLPLIRQTNVDREWTIRKGSGGKDAGETEFKYRLRRERENAGAEETGMLTIQRSIKF
ncbi:MAG TPA: hypothetical protein PKO44_01645 [Candidatus Omnitrophota bacterium]|nr:hypothetical protein [Candidatus Omnitrophota bacterium]